MPAAFAGKVSSKRKRSRKTRTCCPTRESLQFPRRAGKPLKFRVTGRSDCYVWGTDIYTADSPLATAAVHAGAIKVGTDWGCESAAHPAATRVRRLNEKRRHQFRTSAVSRSVPVREVTAV